VTDRPTTPRLLEIAREEETGIGDFLTPDQLHAALVRVEEWADELDETAQRTVGRTTATHPTADVLRVLLSGTAHGEDPM
jgi:hypothetical protein